MTPSTHARPWLVYSDSNPHTRLRLFCFPYAGGNATLYSTWSRALPSEVAVCPIQLPGRGSRWKEKPFTSAAELVAAVANSLAPLFEQPFALFGHSMGGLLSFELTRELRRRGLPQPRQLFVSAFRAPHLPDPDPPMHNMPDADLVEELKRLNGTPAEVLADPELLRMLLPTLRADASVCETYAHAPEAPLDLPLAVFGGLGDPKITQAELEEWRTHTRGPCALRMIPGDHFFVHHSPLLLPALRADLEAVLAGLRPGSQHGGDPTQSTVH
jgi:surfactin synthase thioesterase subunit